MTTWSCMNLQDSASPIMEQLIFFHDHTMMIITMILAMVLYFMASTIINELVDRYMLEGQTMELMWTIVPAVILLFITTPSLRLLYLMDEIHNPIMTIKTIGHQWYWSYEYSDFVNVEFDSYMTPYEGDNKSMFRLLETDNHVTLPMHSFIRIIVTAADVLHSWTIPSLGIKADATPGRLNQSSFMINRPGLLYGQCSEICGANHSFMPIVIESVSTENFIEWIKKLSE
ncbi:cytochrome c oxidase subunit II (mitochondrion) [Zootermopsis nevadensis]|uniref:Cytochrome c oxidase subunit 2 n=2 Tax=Zootermopsis nevadensis TaxID=136037 RepID=A0A0U1WNR2_ZOONE|nr:cytochrome c oxidase subunit II [Zootermopsis nevadensis]AIG24356.1 cytochrome c oxidase subunit II [Zootermopsis nevadensis]